MTPASVDSPPFTSIQLPLDLSNLLGAPIALREHTANFSAFNPTLLSTPSDAKSSVRLPPSALLFFRVSNMHFCPDAAPPRNSWRDSVKMQRQIYSYLGFARLDRLHYSFQTRGAILHSASELFISRSCENSIDAGNGVFGSFRGAEDPRAIWSPDGTPWLVVSAWTNDCRRLRMHLLRFDDANTLLFDGADPETLAPPRHVPLTVVGGWPTVATPGADREWIYDPPHPEALPLQKNWLPFFHDGMLYVEYAIEPHIVLRVDASSGHCTAVGSPYTVAPSARFPSFMPLSALESHYGSRFSGGAPPLHLPDWGIFLGLAHIKFTQGNSHHVGTSSMLYHQIFYAFVDRPPFEIVARGAPFTLPEQTARRPTVQFASGMTFDDARETITISYSTLDCGMQLTSRSLRDVLKDIAIIW